MVRLVARWGSALIVISALTFGSGHRTGAAGAASLGYRAPINLAHLDSLHDTVPYTMSIPGHATTDPGTPLDTWWVYANYNKADGSYTRTGGGEYHPITNTYGQGAFDTDDVTRAAVAYLTHYRYYGDAHSLQYARGALRFVMYMQTTSGPNAGNFVLWMQPDGALNPTPTPPDAPNPADAGASYWLARSLWALGEGYATFRAADPAFADALAARMDLAMGALDGELVGPNDGQYYTLHGFKTPKWLISDGADASSEALLGLAAYYGATGNAEAGKLANELGSGIAGYQVGSPRDWPWGALLPWTRSVSDWHAWAAHMANSLAVAGPLLRHTDWVAAAARDATLFETHQQVAFGPVQGLLPAPDDVSQIAYGAETTADGLLAVGHATGKRAYRQLAGLAAAWFLGNNPVGATIYQADTGVVYDGINGDGTINHNSGAESTIEGLLALMNAVNDPVASAYLAYTHVDRQDAATKTEAEAGTLGGGATTVTPASAWTGEALWSGGTYVDLPAGGSDTVAVTAPVAGRYLVYLVFDKQPAPAGVIGVNVAVDGVAAGTDDQGGAGAQGDSPNPDYLWIDSVVVPGTLDAGPHTVTLTGIGATHAKVDAVMLQPMIEDKVLDDGAGNTLAVYKSFAGFSDGYARAATPAAPGVRLWLVSSYRSDGRPFAIYPLARAYPRTVLVPPYGYAIVTGRSP
jgi:hypothetical protein